MEKQKASIKNQEDLDRLMETEKGMFYLSISGVIPMFNGSFIMTKIEADSKLASMAVGTSETISNFMVNNDKNSANTAIEVAIQTYLIPYRIH